MRYYMDEDLDAFLEENVEAVIELIKKAYISTKEYYKDKIEDDFLYFNMYKTFTNGYCFYFARMLRSIYKNAKFIVVDHNYATISHIYTYINGFAYDINGKRILNEYFILTNKELKIINLNHKQIKDDIYGYFKWCFYNYLNDYINYNKELINKNIKSI